MKAHTKNQITYEKFIQPVNDSNNVNKTIYQNSKVLFCTHCMPIYPAVHFKKTNLDSSLLSASNILTLVIFGRKQSLASGRAKALRDQMGNPKDQDKTSRQSGQMQIVRANGLYAGEKPDNRPFSIYKLRVGYQTDPAVLRR